MDADEDMSEEDSDAADERRYPYAEEALQHPPLKGGYMIFFLFFIAAIVIGYLMLKSPDFATAVRGVIAVLVVIFIIAAVAASCS